jgi:alpha-aminoadipic semialdehyde synthase
VKRSLIGLGFSLQGAMEIFEQLPHRYVSPEELAEMARTGSGDRNCVYGLHASYEHFMSRKSDGGYSRSDYFAHPEQYRSKFTEKVFVWSRSSVPVPV